MTGLAPKQAWRAVVVTCTLWSREALGFKNALRSHSAKSLMSTDKLSHGFARDSLLFVIGQDMNRLALILVTLIATASRSVAQQSETETASRLQQLKATVASNGPIQERFNALDQFAKEAAAADSIALLISALDDQSPELRGLAARKLGEIRPATGAAVTALIAHLDDQDYRTRWISNHFAMQRAVRFDVAEALGRIGAPSQAATPALVNAAKNDDDPEVRVSAALALLRIDPEDNVPLRFLVASLGNDKKGTAGPMCAAEALEQLGERAKPAFDALVSATEHADEFVRMSAIDALAAIDGKAAIKILTRCLSDKDPQVRETASDALGTLGPLSAPAVDDLIVTLGDDSDTLSFHVRRSAARTLGLIGLAAAPALSKLEQLAADSGDEEMQRIASISVRQIRNSQRTNR